MNKISRIFIIVLVALLASTAIALILWQMYNIAPMVVYIILAVFILLVMITIHEFGHYIAGKVLKFKINEFAIGFGPKLFSVKKKNGEIFSIRIFPLGGFCAFEGENEDEPEVRNDSVPFAEIAPAVEEKSQPIVADKNTELKSFNDQAPWKRIIVLLSGGVFNIISAVFFSFLFIIVSGFPTHKIDSVLKNPSTDAYYNDLRSGDIILAVNGEEVGIMKNFYDMTSGVAAGERIILTVVNDGERREVSLLKQSIESEGEDGEVTQYDGYGFMFSDQPVYMRVSFGYAIKNAIPLTIKLAWSILSAFGSLITGGIGINELTGPVGTIGGIAKLSAINWRNIFILLPLIAANLGLFNLFPVPALDGSKVVFCCIEWIAGKPVNRTVEAYIHFIGLIMLLGFSVILDLISFAL